MRNAIKFLGIISLAVMIGFVVTSCNDEDDGGKEKDVTSITISGTITVAEDGQPVPFIIVNAYTEGWAWYKETGRISSSEPNSPWSLEIPSFSSSTQIFFQISGYENQNLDNITSLFTINLNKNTFKTTVKNTDVNNINLNVGNLEFDKIEGTININNNNEAFPSLMIQMFNNDQSVHGQILFKTSNTNDIPWSIKILPTNEDPYINFGITCFDGPKGPEEKWVFQIWNSNYSVKLSDLKNNNFSLDIGDVNDLLGHWTKWDSEGVNVDFKFNDGELEVIVSGTSVDWDQRWRGTVEYNDIFMSFNKDKYYEISIGMRTESGERDITVLYYGDQPTSTYLAYDLEIDQINSIYTFTTEKIPSEKEAKLQFQCGNELGTYFIESISITEVSAPAP